VPKDKRITIPCKTYVKKYIEARYGGPLRITNHSVFGVFIYAVIEKNYYEKRNRKCFSDSFANRHFNDSISFIASDFTFENIGFDVSHSKALVINRFLEQQLEEHLFLYCDAYVLAGRQRKDAIIEFSTKYNIDLEIDITFDSLKQTEYRLRRKRETTPLPLGPAERPILI
jgi:hypothetical protein